MESLGFIETRGFSAAVEAADSALKSASVSLVGQKRVGSGLVTIIITGSVAAVKAAVEAGTESASVVGEVVASQVIANPHADLDKIINAEPEKKGVTTGKVTVQKQSPAAKTAPSKKSPGV